MAERTFEGDWETLVRELEKRTGKDKSNGEVDVWQFHKSAFRLSVIKSKGGKCILEPMRTKTKKTSKQPQARENAGDQVVNGFSLHFIGCESDTSFLDQSQSEVELNQSNPWLLWHLIENCFVMLSFYQFHFNGDFHQSRLT